MKKIIVKLTDGTIYEYQSEFFWGYEDKLNDLRTEFITIGNLIVKKENVISIETIDLDKVENKESEEK